MEPGIQLRIVYRDSQAIKARISGSNGSFAGTANVYFGPGELAEIAEKLRGFPTNAEDVREIIVGTFDPKFAGGGVKMRFYCVNRAAQSCVALTIVSGHDSDAPSQSAEFTIPIEAAEVDSFTNELNHISPVAGQTACLRARSATKIP